ncbi:MAG TPA: Ger(x)C family spore germination protein [Syntrophomonadaceae bacterium]|nr:Ger(x)C family spore germination protein [Syntrophomonadaceae bacterium]
MKSDKKIIATLKINKKIKYSALIIIIISQFLISGCWNYNEINNTAIPLAVGFDYKDNQALLSIQVANPSGQEAGSGGSGGSGGSSPKSLVVTATGSNIIEAARRVLLSFPRTPIYAHAHTLVIGESVATKDLALIMDILARNKNFRKAANLYVFSGGTVDKCMQAQLPPEAYSVPGLDKMIKNQELLLGIYFPISLGKFEEKLDNPGIDAYAPRVIIKNKTLTLDGMAVFKGRKMAGVLNEKESRGFRFLRPDQINGGILSVNYPPGSYEGNPKLIVIELIRSQASVKPNINSNGITMRIKITAEANYYGQNSLDNILTIDDIKGIEAACNRQITSDIQASVSHCQSLESDVFGWGQLIGRTQPAEWNELKNDWPSTFAGVKTDIKVNLKIRRSYLTNKTFKFRE